MTNAAKPAGAEGLYDPRYEHDACGVAMVARLDNRPTHEVIELPWRRWTTSSTAAPRAPTSAPATAPGSSSSCPTRFLRGVAGFELPEPGRYGVAMCFLPQDTARAPKVEALLELNVRVEGQRVLGWRDVPVDEAHIGETANRSRPYIKQLFVGAGPGLRVRPGRLRAQALRHPPHRRARRGARLLRRRASPRARSSTRGC